MKNKCWLTLGVMLSTSLLAQQATNPAPSAPIEMPAAAPAATIAPATANTNAPAAKAAKKKSAKKGEKAAQKKSVKKAAAKKREGMPELKTVPLVAGPATVVASNVNVRGQARLKSEVVTRVTKGDSVTVLKEIVRNNSGPDERSAGGEGARPPGAHVWVNTSFIDAATQTVKPKKLNLRSGAGENYSVIGLLKRGDAVKTITTKGDWTEIEAPTNAYAFMAAQYLKQGPAEAPAPTPPPPAPPETAPTPAIVAAAPTGAAAPPEAPTGAASPEPPAGLPP